MTHPSEKLDTLIDRLGHFPEAVDLFALLRRVDALSSDRARLGYSRTPRDDAVRLGQQPSSIFAPSTIYSIQPGQRSPAPRITVLSIGLFGPNGPMPLHITEYVRDRARNHADPTPTRFADVFHHRFISLFYRAWADAQPTVHLDRSQPDRFSTYVGSLTGLGFASMRQRDSVQDEAKLFATGHFARLTRNPEGICRILQHYFGIAVRLLEFIKRWAVIPRSEQTRLAGRTVANQLSHGAVAGAATPDVQSNFRLEFGPMDLQSYVRFLPGAANNRKTRDWIRNYVGIEFAWDVDLLLAADEVPQSRLGGAQQLGWTTWLGSRRSSEPARDLRLNPERDCKRFRPRAELPA